MNRIASLLALATLLAVPLGATGPTDSPARWFAGVDLVVGGVDFSLGFSSSDRHHGGRRYYYVTSEPLAQPGYECGSACFLRDDLYYHHPECPLVLQHFERHGFDPFPVWVNLPHRGLRHYPYHHGPGYHDDHHDRHHGDSHGRRRGGRYDDDDSDSDGHRHRGGRGRGRDHD